MADTKLSGLTAGAAPVDADLFYTDQSATSKSVTALQLKNYTAGGFTAGSIPFGGASGLLTQDNSKLFWDDTNGIFGVGNIALPSAYFGVGVPGIIIGNGGVAANYTPGFSVNGSSGNGGGPFCSFQRNSSDIAYFGTLSGVRGGTSSNLAFQANNVALGGGIEFWSGGTHQALLLNTGGDVVIGGVAANLTPLTVSGYSLAGTDAHSMLDLSGTWNTSGNPSLLKMVLTDTAFGSTSKIIDIQTVSTGNIFSIAASNNFVSFAGAVGAGGLGNTGYTFNGSTHYAHMQGSPAALPSYVLAGAGFTAYGTLHNLNSTSWAICYSSDGAAITKKALIWDTSGNITLPQSLLFTGATSGTVTINPKAIAGTWTLTLPDSAGTNTFVLTTDGTGVTSWTTPGAATMAIGSAVTTGTTGSILFVGAGPVLAQDNSNLFWDHTNKALVVGSTFTGAFVVGANGATNPAFTVDASAATQVAGLRLKGAATGGTVALDLLDSGANTNLTINAKGSGTIGIGSVSTGAVTITPALTLNNALTYGGVALSNAVTGTGNMVLSAGPTLTGTLTAATGTFSGALTASNTTAASSNTTGGLIVSGGAGIAKDLYLATGTTAIAPLTFTSGTNLTTARAGGCEFDGTAFYNTSVASARQVVSTEQVVIQNATRTFTANTSAQAIFNATANGAITLASSTTYEFEMMVAASGFSASTWTESLGFAGTATLTSIAYFYDCQGGSTLAGPNAVLSGFVATAAATQVLGSVTTTGLVLRVRGTVRVNAGGTFIPQLTQGTNAAAAVLQAGSFVRFWPIGTNTVTNIGNWS